VTEKQALTIQASETLLNREKCQDSVEERSPKELRTK
jgi:hypothetical protein